MPEVFVVGSGRSGSTLLAALLSQHPRVNVGPESPYLGWVLHRPWRYLRRGWRSTIEHDLLRSPSFSLSGIDGGALHQLIASSAAPTDVIARVFQLLALERGADTWIDKTPSNVLRLPLVSRAFPSARFVHLVRDGRAVAESLVRVGWASSLERAAFNWRRRVTAGMRFEARHPDRVLRIRYEELIMDPARTLEPVWDLARVDPLPDVLERFRANSGGFELRTAFPTAHEGLWRDLQDPFQLVQLVPEQLRSIEMVQADVLQALGYQLACSEAAPSRSRLLRAALRSSWELDRARRRRRMP